MPLFGTMEFTAQQRVLSPLQKGRKIVLATAIAETSLTLPDITVVIDGGLARRSRFSPATGMSRLVTERASKAEAEQRMGTRGACTIGHMLQIMGQIRRRHDARICAGRN